MISQLTMMSFLAVGVVCLAVPIGCMVYCMRKNKGGNLLSVALMGFAAAMLSNSFAGMAMSIKPLAGLSDSVFPLYVILSVAVLCLFEVAARYLVVHFMMKNGIGYYRGFALGTGFGAGLVLLQAMSSFQLFSQAQLINKGTFLDLVTKQGTVTMEDAIKYQETMQAVHASEWFVQALERGVLVVLQIAVTLLLVKFVLQGKHFIGIAAAFGIRMVYELAVKFLSVSYGEYLNRVFSMGLALTLSAVFLIGAAVLCILCIRKLKPMLPVDKIMSPVLPRRQPVQEVKKDKVWQQIREINTASLEPGGSEQGKAGRETEAEEDKRDTALGDKPEE